MRRFPAFTLILVSILATLGQNGPATEPAHVPAVLLRDINSQDSAKADAAAAGIGKLPAALLGELYEISGRDMLSPGGEKRLDAAILAIHQRAAIERKKQQAQQIRDWQMTTGVKAYQASGKRDPRWDKLALDALTGNALHGPQDSFPLFKAAVDAGCDDPLILYYYALRGAGDGELTRVQVLEALSRSLEAYRASAYSPARKLFALARFAQWRLADTKNVPQKDAELIRASLADSLELLKKTPDEHLDENALIDISEGLLKAWSWSLGARKDAFDKVSTVLRDAYPDKALPLVFAMRFYVDWAWEARGDGFAGTVTEEGWRLFDERLSLAEDSGTQAWKLDPTDPWGPTEMLTICMGLGEERPVMETWFARAMLADPDNDEACLRKATYLLPKWHGSEEDVLEFCRECIASGNGRNRIPLQIVYAYKDMAGLDMKQLQKPEIWKDFQDAFEKVLSDKSRLTDDRHRYLQDRGNYLRWACDLQQWQDVMRLSREFGDQIDMHAFGNKALYDYFVSKAARELAKSPAKEQKQK